ncbi:MAG TPA: cytochrome c oxidase assembly protein [Gaiellaceae bacterium]
MSPAPTSFEFEPLYLALAAVAAVAYARAARVHRPSRGRIALFALGLFLVAAPLNSPLETISAHYLLLAHLAQNALVADWAPPLLVLGLSPEMRRALARRGGRPFAIATTPALSLPVWLVAWYGVHVAPFYEWALRTGWGLELEHAILIAAGLLFWWAPLEPEPRRLSAPAAVAYVAIGFVASPWLAVAYIFAPSPFYGFYEHAPRIWDLTADRDQAIGGIIMQAEMTLVFVALLAHLFLRLLEEE